MATRNSSSRRVTRSTNKSESSVVDTNTLPMTLEFSSTGSLITDLSELSSNSISPSLIVKLPYNAAAGIGIEQSIYKQYSESGTMTTPSPPTENARLNGQQNSHKAPDYHTAPQGLTATHHQSQLAGQPLQHVPFMGMNNHYAFNPHLANYAQMTPPNGMSYDYGLNRASPFHPPGLGQHQGPHSAPSEWAHQQPSVPQFYAGPPMGNFYPHGLMVTRNAYVPNGHHATSTMQSNNGPATYSPAMSAGSPFANQLPAVNQPLKNTTPKSTPSPTLTDSLVVKTPSLKDILPLSTLPTLAVNAAKITREEADQRTLPPVGEQLTRLVEEAKVRREIPKCHNTAVIRLVDGQWMVPTACASCQDSKKASQCDRNIPCKACNKQGLTCTTDGFMMALKPAKNHRSFSVKSEVATDSQVAPTPNELKKRKRGSRHDAINYSDAIVDMVDQDLPSSDLDEGYRNSKAPKLAKGDEDFSPGGRQSSPAASNDTVTGNERSGKKKVRGNGVTKKPNGQGKLKGRATEKVSKESYHLNVQEGKSEPYGQPKVWAAKRQQLCETLPYYRAYESAAYTHEGVLYAFLIDREVGIQDKFTDQIIISKCGGGKSQDENGKMVQSKNQAETSATGIAFLRAKNDKLPVAVIAGQGNSASPSKLPHYYNVLDWFQVTDVWCEMVDGVVSLFSRLEKINLTEMSWWAPKETVLAPPNFVSPKTQCQECPSCKNSSKVIFNQGFTCLRRDCKKFFKFDHQHETLDYNEEFLMERTQYLGNKPGPISPPLITLDDEDFGYEGKYRKGIVCPECHCCIRRIHWHFWTCENDDCNFTYRIPQRAISVSDAIAQGRDSTNAKVLPKPICHPDIRWMMKSVGYYDVYEYTIPGEGDEICGFIRLFKSRDVINQQPDGPNDLFEQMQTEDFDLKRNAARLAGNVKEVSTSHWSTNWGAPYKYGVAQDSKGFDEAPDVIIKAVKRLTWAGEQTLTENHEPFHPFNEMLTLGYFEQTYIGFHDDGEKELGPTVATLSLGADATMEFRPKVSSKVGSYKGANQSKGKGCRKKRVMLSITLNHGDIIIMHGRAIQKHYEHAVKPHGKLRYALTSRYIDPERMASNADREHSAKAGKLPPGSERFNYYGDFNAKTIEKKQILHPLTKMKNHLDALRLTGELSAEDEKSFLMARLNALHQTEANTGVVATTDASMAAESAGAETEPSFAEGVLTDTQMG